MACTHTEPYVWTAAGVYRTDPAVWPISQGFDAKNLKLLNDLAHEAVGGGGTRR